MKNGWICSLLTLFIVTAATAAEGERTWTSSKGKKLTAVLMERHAESVLLKRSADGKTVTVQIAALSKHDQAFLEAIGVGYKRPLLTIDPAKLEKARQAQVARARAQHSKTDESDSDDEPATTAVDDPDIRWKRFEDQERWFAVIDCPVDFDTAKKIARGMKVDLATIRSKEENEFIKDMFVNKYKTNELYFGLERSGKSMKWPSRAKSKYYNWAVNEPNNLQEIAGEYRLGNGEWNDARGDRRLCPLVSFDGKEPPPKYTRAISSLIKKEFKNAGKERKF